MTSDVTSFYIFILTLAPSFCNHYTVFIMASKKTTNERSKKSKPLTKKNDRFYEIVGGLGGNATLQSKGKEHFSRMATLRHQRNREAKLLAGNE